MPRDPQGAGTRTETRTEWLRRVWRTFWFGPVCRLCGTRHHERLTDIALCIAHRATGLDGHGAEP